MDDRAEVTLLLEKIRGGDEQAVGQLLPIVYKELRKIAASIMRRERADHTLQPTAVVHEAFLRIVQGDHVDFDNRAHFLAVAARCMRHVLVDHARRRLADKRGGEEQQRVELDDEIGLTRQQSEEVLALHEALEQLEALDPRQARVVEMHYFAGDGVAEIAHVLNTSERTVKRELQTARLFLKQRLQLQGMTLP
jgi:RNA polymerase sigma factor (TIGR02999 family)